jgi:hypothetical protein
MFVQHELSVQYSDFGLKKGDRTVNEVGKFLHWCATLLLIESTE